MSDRPSAHVSSDLATWDHRGQTDQGTVDRAVTLLVGWATRDGVDLVVHEGPASLGPGDERGEQWLAPHWAPALDAAGAP